MAARHLLALIVAIGLPVTAQAFPIVEIDAGGNTATESFWIWEGPGISDLGTDQTDLSIHLPTLSSADHDDFVAGVLGGGSAGSVGAADLASAGTWVWREATEADAFF
jgi:hypothetical protein